MRSCLLILLLSLLWGGHAFASTVDDSVRVYFHHGYSVLDFSLRDNRKVLDDFVARMTALSADTSKHIISIYVEGNASPSGGHAANRKLSEQRAQRVIDYLRSQVPLPEALITVVADGIDWDGLAALVEKATDLPARERILDILRNTPVWVYDSEGRIVDGCKKQLMDLQGGKVYRMLKERFFAELRNTYIEVRYEQAPAPDTLPQVTDTVTSVSPDAEAKDDAATDVATALATTTVRPIDGLLHRLAIKTNLLYDAILMPSLEVEYRINPRWSVNLEGDMAWWKNTGKKKFYQLATISPEGRYWFKTRKPWHGHYIGLFGGFSWYDLENGKEGYRGEAVTAGLTYGYMFPITRSLSLEAGIGLGYMNTRYQEYLPIDGHFVYQQTKRMGYFGPLKLKFNLVWRLWKADKEKGGMR